MARAVLLARVPVALVAMIGGVMALGAPAAQALSFEKWTASNCSTMKCGSTLAEIKELKTP
ncbi:MAG: hypothetical protein ACYDA6_09220, partial [Solirubrobacteraceae bacterium]